jgi:hypothetical protein
MDRPKRKAAEMASFYTKEMLINESLSNPQSMTNQHGELFHSQQTAPQYKRSKSTKSPKKKSSPKKESSEKKESSPKKESSEKKLRILHKVVFKGTQSSESLEFSLSVKDIRPVSKVNPKLYMGAIKGLIKLMKLSRGYCN